MKKRWIVAVVLCIYVFFGNIQALAEKHQQLPPIFAVEVLEEGRPILEGKAYVYKEYLQTTNEAVNAELKAMADAYEEKRIAELAPDPKKRGNRNSRLDIDTVYYRTGERWLSTMMLARVVWYREQLSLDFSTQTFDLATGQQIFLTDLFSEDSEAWDILSQGVQTQLQAVYPGEERREDAIAELSAKEAIAQASFTLSGMELTLHYPAAAILDEKTNLIHVRFYYPQFEGMLTSLGREVTDNSKWKMVAITCDDGPKDFNSTDALNAFRKVGARVTYFVVGKQLERYGDVFQRQFDQNHTFGNHTYNHWSGYTFKTGARRVRELTDTDVLTLALVGETAPFFRAPGGTYPPWMEAELTLPIIQWSLDTYDYTGKKPARILYSIEKGVKEHDIILCHDTGKYLREAVPLFGKYLTENGYMMVTLQELLVAQEVEAKSNVVYWSFRDGENSEAKGIMPKKKR